MNARRMRRFLCAGVVLGVAGVGCAAQRYECCSSITPEGTVPSLAKVEREIAANYGRQYARNAVAFLKVLDDPSTTEKVPLAERMSIQFDMLYLLASERLGVAHSLFDFLSKAGRQTGAVGRERAPFLHSGVDRYKVMLRLSQPWYVYLFQMDSTGKIDPLFPHKTYAPGLFNPVVPNQTYEVPYSPNWLRLDTNVGFEKIYLFVSKKRQPKLERLYGYFIAAGDKIVKREWKEGAFAPERLKPAKPGLPPMPEMIAMAETVTTTRGTAGLAPGPASTVGIPQFGNLNYRPTTYMAQGTEFVQTLWFHHTK